MESNCIICVNFEFHSMHDKTKYLRIQLHQQVYGLIADKTLLLETYHDFNRRHKYAKIITIQRILSSYNKYKQGIYFVVCFNRLTRFTIQLPPSETLIIYKCMMFPRLLIKRKFVRTFGASLNQKQVIYSEVDVVCSQ